MTKIIAGLLVGLFLLPASAFAQSVDVQAQRDAIIYQLIALLTEQLHQLQAQLAEMKANEAEKMAYEDIQQDSSEPVFEIHKDGSKFEIWSNVKGDPKKVTVTLKDGPTSLTLWAGLTKKGAYLTDAMSKNGDTYTINLEDRLTEKDGSFNGKFEVLFPEDYEPSVTYTVEYDDANYKKISTQLNKNATTKPTRDEE